MGCECTACVLLGSDELPLVSSSCTGKETACSCAFTSSSVKLCSSQVAAAFAAHLASALIHTTEALSSLTHGRLVCAKSSDCMMSRVPRTRCGSPSFATPSPLLLGILANHTEADTRKPRPRPRIRTHISLLQPFTHSPPLWTRTTSVHFSMHFSIITHYRHIVRFFKDTTSPIRHCHCKFPQIIPRTFNKGLANYFIDCHWRHSSVPSIIFGFQSENASTWRWILLQRSSQSSTGPFTRYCHLSSLLPGLQFTTWSALFSAYLRHHWRNHQSNWPYLTVPF